jgi:hypothetical protein
MAPISLEPGSADRHKPTPTEKMEKASAVRASYAEANFGSEGCFGVFFSDLSVVGAPGPYTTDQKHARML